MSGIKYPVPHCSHTSSKNIDADPATSFHEQLRRSSGEEDDLGSRCVMLPIWRIYQTDEDFSTADGVEHVRILGRGRNTDDIYGAVLVRGYIGAAIVIRVRSRTCRSWREWVKTY
jgi:hypothetical protein